jgi:PXA domain
VKSSTREVYHKLNPHPGFSPVLDSSDTLQCAEQQENERLYRHLLSQGVLAVLLPTEDLENVCLRTLVEDVLADLILGNEVGGRTCESWFIWTTVSKIIALTKQRNTEPMLSSEKMSDAAAELNRLERFGLLSEEVKNEPVPGKSQSIMLLWIWKMLYSIYLAYLTIQFLIGGLLRTAFSNPEASIQEANPADHFSTSKTSTQVIAPRPVLSYRAFGLISQLVGVSRRMPWLSGFFSLIQSLALTGPGKLGDADSILDQ